MHDALGILPRYVVLQIPADADLYPITAVAHRIGIVGDATQSR